MDKAIICVHCGCALRGSSHHGSSHHHSSTSYYTRATYPTATAVTYQAPRYQTPTVYVKRAHQDDTLDIIIKVFMILGCISLGWMIIPLAWCIPMTVITFRKINDGESLDTGLKICTLLFVSLVAGICMLCRDD